jgi:hypothetical protein
MLNVASDAVFMRRQATSVLRALGQEGADPAARPARSGYA